MARYRLGVMVLLAAAAIPMAAAPAQAQLFVNISVRTMPPPLPVYVQPPLPGPDYIWLPGYWAWDDDVDDYFWVPGTWALAPRPGYVWTPPWWGWSNGAYVFHTGYWGTHVGWYGGISYGFGYTGLGYEGGYWRGPHYFYNRSVTNVTNVNITNVYNKTVIVNNTTVNKVSFNGGPGGVQMRPTPALLAASREPHLAPTADQQRHFETARRAPQMFASANRGAPPVAATMAPARLSGPGVIRAQAAGRPFMSRPALASQLGGAPRPGTQGMPAPAHGGAPGFGGPGGPGARPAVAVRRPPTFQGYGQPGGVRLDNGPPRAPRPGNPQVARPPQERFAGMPPQPGGARGFAPPRPPMAGPPGGRPPQARPARPPAPPRAQPRGQSHEEKKRG